MKIGILVPLAQELRSLTHKKVQFGSFINLSDSLLVCQTGIGRKNTQRAVQQMISFGIDQMIGWGTAAGLSPTALEGDLLVPDAVVVKDKKYPTNHQFSADLLAMAPHGLRWHKGLIYGSDVLLASVESKQELFALTRCVGADMESGALAEMAAENDIPFNVIRSISDPVDMRIPGTLLAGLGLSGDLRIKDFLKTAIIRPYDWWPTIKLASNFYKAQGTLKIMAQLLNNLAWTQKA